MNTWLIIVALSLALLSLLLLGLSAWGRARPQAAARRRLDNIIGHPDEPVRATSQSIFVRLLEKLGRTQELRSRGKSADAEIGTLLIRAGWHRSRAATVFYGATMLLPVAGAVLAVLYGLAVGQTGVRVAGLAFMGAASGYLLPRYLLRYRAAERQRRMAAEVPVMLRVLNVLFEASLSLEHALAVLREQAGALLPVLSPEIDVFLQRVNAGVDRTVALEQMASETDVPELRDAVAVLAQAARLGGGVRQSLARLATTIETREQSALREKVGKLSAKMTIVMMLFLFPALFIFLAGPGLLAIGAALGRVSG